MTKKTLMRLGSQIFLALVGVFQSAFIFSVNYFVLYNREFSRAFDPNIRIDIDTGFWMIAVNLLGFLSLSLVLAVHGWGKGKRLPISASEQNTDAAAWFGGCLLFLLISTVIVVSLSLLFI